MVLSLARCEEVIRDGVRSIAEIETMHFLSQRFSFTYAKAGQRMIQGLMKFIKELSLGINKTKGALGVASGDLYELKH